MNFQRRGSLPPLPHDKENNQPLHKTGSKRSLHLKLDLNRSIADIKIVQIENFVDESLLVHLPVSREQLEIPVFDEMPSVDLETPTDWILTPRDFDEFRREVQQYQQHLDRYQDLKRYVRPPATQRPLPTVDWQHQRQFYQNQVIRHNCNNSEYQRFLLLNRRKMREHIDEVFLPNDSAFKGMSKVGECRHNICPKAWKRLWVERGAEFPYKQLYQGIYRTENLLSCFISLPPLYQLSLFEGQNFENKAAFFVKLHKQGTWRYIMIDNMMPYADTGYCFLSGGFALTLLEKAWAKHLGSYSRLDTIQEVPLTEIMSDLTGAPSEELRCNHPKILQQIKAMLAKKYILLASNQGDHEKQMKVEYKLGIPCVYSYPIEDIDGEYLVMRNAWGCQTNSPFFGSEQMRLHYTSLKEFFSCVVVNKVIEDGHHNSVTVRQKKGFYSLIELLPKEDCEGFVTLSQIDKLTSMEQYSHCRMVLFENGGERVLYLQEVDSYSKNTHFEVSLTHDCSYLVLIEMQWIAKEYESTLSLLTTRPVSLNTQKYSSQNDFLLTLKKQKTKSEKLSLPSTPSAKTSRSERFRK